MSFPARVADFFFDAIEAAEFELSAAAASAGDMPAAMLAAICCSMWKRSSLFRRSSDFDLWKSRWNERIFGYLLDRSKD